MTEPDRITVPHRAEGPDGVIGDGLIDLLPGEPGYEEWRRWRDQPPEPDEPLP